MNEMQGSEVIISLPIEPDRPRGLFTSVAQMLPSLERDGVDRTGSGVTHVPFPCTDSVAGPLDCDSDGAVFIPGDTGDNDKSAAIRYYPSYEDPDSGTDPDSYPWVRHNPFKIVDGLSCSTISLPMENSPTRSLPNTLRALIRRSLSGMFTAELVTGDASGNPSLNDLAEDYGTATDMQAAAFAIENHLADRLHGSQGTVLLPLGLLAVAVDSGWVMISGNSIETVSGHKVIADPGFLGDPTNPKDVTPAAQQIFAMGSIFYGSRAFRELEGATDLDTNRVNQLIETYAQLAYSPCTVGTVTLEA
jgi:hypothetical protein